MSFLRRDLDLEKSVEHTLSWNKIAMGGEFDFSQQRKDLQHRLLLEEVQELRDALDDNDKVETVDALCDILFVGVFAWFINSDINGGTIDIGGMDHELVDTGYTLEDLYTQVYALTSDKKYRTVCELIIQTSVLFDFDLKKSYNNVVISNFSKFPIVDDFELVADLEWFDIHSKYDGVVETIVDGHYVFRAEDGLGKIVKPRCFVEPSLAQFIGG